MSKPAEEFERLDLPRKELAGTKLCRYRVYTDDSNFQVVEAVSALEALQSSGIKKASKIVRDALYFNSVLDTKMFAGETPEAVEPAPVVAAAPEVPAPEEPPVAEAAAPVEAPPAPEPVQEAPLSNDDVNRLLNQ